MRSCAHAPARGANCLSATRRSIARPTGTCIPGELFRRSALQSSSGISGGSAPGSPAARPGCTAGEGSTPAGSSSARRERRRRLKALIRPTQVQVEPEEGVVSHIPEFREFRNTAPTSACPTPRGCTRGAHFQTYPSTLQAAAGGSLSTFSSISGILKRNGPLFTQFGSPIPRHRLRLKSLGRPTGR